MPTLDVTNPRTGQIDFHMPVATQAAVREAAARLREGQPRWAASLSARMAAMTAWAEAMERGQAPLTEALTSDTGRRLLSHIEVTAMTQRIRYWVERAPALLDGAEERPSRMVPGVACRQQKPPYPLVGVISPWNFPLTLSLVDAIPALCAGAAVLLKPSEITPRFVPVLERIVAEVPELAAVFGILSGDGDTGGHLVDCVDMLCFTGSVATGRKIAVRAAENFIPACLELGGKDPAIVLADADLEAAADAILRSAAGACGQACMSLERVYVDLSCFDAFRDLLVARVQKLQFNAEDIYHGTLPPFIDPRQAGKVADQLADALRLGAELHCGGPPESHGGGHWMKPAVLTGIRDDMLLMREETFGPILPLIPFADDEEAISLANAGDFGLSGSVFGEEGHAIAVAERLDVGAVGINDASMTTLVHDMEKQSFGHSGLGPSRMGDTGLLRFLRDKALLIQRGAPASIDALDESHLPREPSGC